MLENQIVDLAVLGVARQRPTPLTRIVLIAKGLVPDYWQPTSDVIETSCRRSLDAGFLQCIGNRKEPDTLAITELGMTQVCLLLQYDPGNLTRPSTLTMDALQICFLDSANDEIKSCVLKRHATRLQLRLEQFEDRCQLCPYQGRFARLWMGAERSRLDCMAQLLAKVTADPAQDCQNSQKLMEIAK